ncbi:MAG: DUF4157 domain-containing protein, partial [Deltaproteobacteria bacterium]|nr:DUF4157 domain-containing protein [Deltaproteobacteria bacterium]
MALSLSRRKQNAKAFELVFHEEQLRGQLRQQGEDRVQQTVAQAQDRFGNLRLAGALQLGGTLGSDLGGLNVDAAPAAGDLGFLHDQMSLALAGFDSGLLGADASNSALASAMSGGLPGFEAGYDAGTASAQDLASREAEGEVLDLQNAAVKNMHSRGGSPLPAAVAARLGAAFGHDFSHVRVHADAGAAQAAEALNARAFAIGADIWFGRGAFNPGTAEGDRILAHELTHVVQADEGRLPTAAGPGLNVSSPTDSAEREAYANEKSIPAAMGTSSTTELSDAPITGEASPHIAGVSLSSADIAAPAEQSDAGREGTQTEATDGALMRDFLGKKRSGRVRPPGAPRPGGEAPVELVKGMLDKAGVDPAARPDNGGPGLDGAVKAPQDLLNNAAKNVPGLSGALKPADMDVTDRNGNRPQSLIAGDGLKLNVNLGNKNAGVNINANLGGKDGNNVAVNGQFSDGKNNRVNVSGKAGDGGNSLGVNGSLGDDKNRVNFDGKVGDGGNSLSADAKLAGGLVDASLKADENGVNLDAKLGDKVDDKIKDKVKEVAQELKGDKKGEKKEGEEDKDKKKEGEEGKEGEPKEGEAKDGEGKTERAPGDGGPSEAKGDAKGTTAGGPGGGGPGTEEGGGGPGMGMPGLANAMGGGPVNVRSLGNLQLPAFNLKKDEEAGLKKKTGLTPQQHQQQIQQHVDRIKAQVDQMREGLRVYAETKVQAIELEITTAKEALGG